MESNRNYARRYAASCNKDNILRPENMETERKMPLGISYVPWQEFAKMYDPLKALHSGTAFPELDLPFCGVRGGCL